jgi:hypothetical protein
MANELVHDIKLVDARTARTVGELIDALSSVSRDTELDMQHRVELLLETFSDGSAVHEVRVRRGAWKD